MHVYEFTKKAYQFADAMLEEKFKTEEE
jgi:hypothetical protein